MPNTFEESSEGITRGWLKLDMPLILVTCSAKRTTTQISLIMKLNERKHFFKMLCLCIVTRNGKVVWKVVWIECYLQLDLSSRRY